MVISTTALRHIQHLLFISASLLLVILLNQALYKISLVTEPNLLNAETYQTCNGSICQTVITKR